MEMDLSPMTIAAALAMGLVLIVLIAGVVNLAMTGAKARSRSNKLMRLRVLVQFIAVVLLMAGLWLKTHSQ
jgi:threonine/homoserine/homoserine lactone efflux protein